MRDPLARMDATAQAELVRRREATPRELVEAALRRIERVDPDLNSVPLPLVEEALATVEASLGGAPFEGVPFLLKDVGAQQAGLPYCAGNRALHRAGYRSPADSALGAHFRRLGLVTVGKSNTPEFGMQSTTQPLAFGPTRNPWDPARSPGGSSGGACAAVAAGLVPAAHASDGAGSIRIPAAWCGLVALKPSRDRAFRDEELGGGAVEFVVTRSLRDVVAFLDAFLVRPAPLDRAQRRLRVGLLADMPGGSVHPECALAARKTACALESLGHVVEPAWPAALFETEERALHGLLFAPRAHRACLEELAELLERQVGPDDVEPFIWDLAHLDVPWTSPAAYRDSLRWTRDWARRVRDWWAGGYDLLLTPTVGEPPPPLEALDGASLDALALVDRMAPHMAFTEPFSATGQPALTLPVHWTPEGLPVGAQLVADVGGEDLLLRVAEELEQVLPREEREPLIHA